MGPSGRYDRLLDRRGAAAVIPSVYILGSAGAGKSTFMDQLLSGLGAQPGGLEELCSLPNRKNTVYLRGHRLIEPGTTREGMYLGVRRDNFPGTDGLDRASSPVGEKWLREGPGVGYVLAEGATLGTNRFLTALAETTRALVVLLAVSPEAAQIRFEQRGSSQDPTWVRATATRAANRANEAAAAGALLLRIDSEDPLAWGMGLDLCEYHLRGC